MTILERGKTMMEQMQTKKVSIRKLVNEFDVDVAFMPSEIDYFITTTDINRPGLQLSGYYDHFPSERIQVIGKVEYSYYSSLDEETKMDRMDRYMSYELPVIIVAREQQPDEIMIKAAKKYKTRTRWYSRN